MTELKEELLAEAREKYGDIRPCGPRLSLDDCFTVMGDKLVLWFDDASRSTHLVSAKTN